MKKPTHILLLLLLFFSCKKEKENPSVKEERITPQLITELHPVDDAAASYNISNNVIQGITAFENGWFTAQTSANTFLLINYLDANGNSLFHKRLSLDSHGQDLSLEIISNNELYLYTTIGDFDDNRNTGLLRLKVQLTENRDWPQTTINIDSIYDLNYSNCTPSLNTAKDKLAIRSKKSVLVHLKENILANDFTPLYHFDLNDGQLKDNEQRSMWFQGIAMQNGLVYCLTGNAELTTHKKIFVYNDKGIVVQKYFFDKENFDVPIDIKFEPESLHLNNNELFFLIMTKNPNTEGNIKYLYKLLIQ
ncbi:MAG TPA: hypothetical protein ENJ95_16580 [Bacteroidetes bacterium]|nr:hypothetical protein [Bacteroidota bacterium]